MSLLFSNYVVLQETPFEALVRQKVPAKPVNCMGLTFKNPLGLAAGLDKDGECIDALGAMGFGSIEIGTVTPRPQPGNDKPRLFRLVDAEGLINRMGFNNLGVDNLVENVKKAHYDGVLGINIGKNKDTPVEQGKDDYLICMEKIYAYAGYIAINISSPNTPGLRTLQYGEALDDLLTAIKNKQNDLQAMHHKYVPIAVKIAPDLSEEELIQVADSLVRHNIDGVIATNTTLDRFSCSGNEKLRSNRWLKWSSASVKKHRNYSPLVTGIKRSLTDHRCWRHRLGYRCA